MRVSERPLSTVPAWIVIGLIVLASAQFIQRKVSYQPVELHVAELAAPPSANLLRLIAAGEPEVLSKLAMLWLQSFDNQPGISIPFNELDYGRVIQWLEASLILSPRSQYPLFMASHLYSRVNNADKQRMIIEFIYKQFLKDPNRRWRWLAHAVIIAQHRLNDMALARRLAKVLRESATGEDIPHWAQQMELGILEAQGEYQSAAMLIGGLLENGQITDPHELLFLNLRLKELKNKIPDAALNSMRNSAR